MDVTSKFPTEAQMQDACVSFAQNMLVQTMKFSLRQNYRYTAEDF